ncbi:MAG TPA: helix-turn-helix transcriptional regulator [Thermoanaerobaculia bacterium]|nr:helix-turn-helix transcriptional regulator [Thermoanaerobaculia bacterium]
MPRTDEALRRAFAERVNRLRERQQMSWKQLAARIGTSVSALTRWGRTETGPRMESIIGLSEALGVTTDYLLLGRGPARPDGSVDPKVLKLLESLYALPLEVREALAQAILGGPISSGRATR